MFERLDLGPLPSLNGTSLSANAYGNRAAELVLAVHGQNPDLVHEWEDTQIAQRLAGSGYYVVCCNMHSNDKSKPGILSETGFVALVDDLLKVLNSDKVVLMGKSWGGRNAVAYAATRPNVVQRLVLSAPAFGMNVEADTPTIAKLTMPVLLSWSQDDAVIPYETHEVYKRSVDDIKFVSQPNGGHMLVPEFGLDIVAFLGLPSKM